MGQICDAGSNIRNRLYVQVYSKLLQLGSHDKSHDLASALPLVGSQSVHMVHYIAYGALNAYSAFLSSLLETELEGLSRGMVYSAMQRAAVTSSHEAGLQNKARSLRERLFNQQELGNGYVKCKGYLQ